MPATRRLAAVLYAYAFLDEFVLLYPLYTLLFADTGLSAAQISALFVLWSVTSIALEVPSGAWADAVSRRALLVLAPVLGALGFGLWVAVPSTAAFAAGFVLWGARGALVSGALEALVWTELQRAGDERSFARLLGRAEASGVVAVLAATLLAAPVMAAGGYRAVGAASVLAGLAGAGVALLFPQHRNPGTGPEERDADGDEPGYLATLRSGLREARADPRVRRAVLLVPAVTALWGALEEYTALLAGALGVATVDVPWWEAVIWAGVTGGGLLAGRAAGLGSRGLALLVATAALATAAGAVGGRAAGLVLVAVAFGAFQVAGVVAQTRLQEAVTGPARATVTSVASMGVDVVAIGVYVVYGVLAEGTGVRGAFALLALPYLAVAGWLLLGGRGERHDGVGREVARPGADATGGG